MGLHNCHLGKNKDYRRTVRKVREVRKTGFWIREQNLIAMTFIKKSKISSSIARNEQCFGDKYKAPKQYRTNVLLNVWPLVALEIKASYKLHFNNSDLDELQE